MLQLPGAWRSLFRTMSKIRILILFFITHITVLFGQNREFLLIGSPEKLVIYNQYEQTLSEIVKKNFGENAPFMVVSLKSFLSDGLTPVIEAAYFNEKIYILRDEKGNPAVNGKTIVKKTATVTQFYREGTLKNDCTGETLSGKKISLKKGSRVKSLFKKNNEIYAGINSGKDLLFLYIPEKDFSEESKEAAGSTKMNSFSNSHFTKLNELIEKYNKIFRSVYRFAGKEFGNDFSTPELSAVLLPREIKIRIKNYHITHRGSVNEFYRSAENILADCDYRKTGDTANTSFRISK